MVEAKMVEEGGKWVSVVLYLYPYSLAQHSQDQQDLQPFWINGGQEVGGSRILHFVFVAITWQAPQSLPSNTNMNKHWQPAQAM